MNEADPKTQDTLLHFGVFTLNLSRRGLYRDQERIRLTAKPLETLIFLVENRGRVVQKQEILNAVWKDTFVTEDTLVHAIREVRRALGDDRDNPRFVFTVPREGYRFVCEVLTAPPFSESINLPTEPEAVSAPAQQHFAAPALTKQSPSYNRSLIWFVIAGLVLVPAIWIARQYLTVTGGSRLLGLTAPAPLPRRR